MRGGVCLSGNVSRRCGKAEAPGSPLLPGWYSCQAAGTYSPGRRRVPGHLRAVPVLVVCCPAGPWWWGRHQQPLACSKQCVGGSGQPGAVLSVPCGLSGWWAKESKTLSAITESVHMLKLPTPQIAQLFHILYLYSLYQNYAYSYKHMQGFVESSCHLAKTWKSIHYRAETAVSQRVLWMLEPAKELKMNNYRKETGHEELSSTSHCPPCRGWRQGPKRWGSARCPWSRVAPQSEVLSVHASRWREVSTLESGGPSTAWKTGGSHR